MSKSKRRTNLAVEEIPEIDLTTVELPVMKIFNPFKVKPLPNQPRKRFFGIKELANSIQAVNRQLLPVIVTQIQGDPRFDAQLVDGERRMQACRYLKRPIIAYIWNGKGDWKEIYLASIAANSGHQPHDPMETLGSILWLVEQNKNQEEIAAVFSKTSGWVSQHYSLRKLDPIVQGWLIPRIIGEEENKKTKPGGTLNVADVKSIGSNKVKAPLSMQLGLQLVKLPPEKQISAGREIIQRKMSREEAKRYVDTLLRGMGIKNRKKSPGEAKKTFLSVVERIIHILGGYADMPYEEINQVLKSMTQGDLNRANKRLDQIAENAIGLRQNIASILSSGAPRGIPQHNGEVFSNPNGQK